MLERCIQLVRTSLHQILKFGLPRIAQYITTLFVLSFISSRIWASWRAPSWSSLLPDRREDWVVGDYPSLEHPARQIRLLILFPTTTGAEIEGTLFTASFLELPVYEAVSYAWGDSNKTRTMTLDGKRHYIAENLWAALSAMRTSKLNRTVWVDAICINQSSVEEKSHQVGMMPYIYERATRVLIWLVESPYPDWAADAWRQQWDPVWAQQEADKDWQATAYWLHSLLDQEYWKRCWVVQEI
ncbi:HET-domain-containing protein, partial [Thozetella sp. PMI_491]